MTIAKKSSERAPDALRAPYDAMGPVDAPNPPAERATLADVQPGGRVRLGDSLPPLPKMQRFTNLYGETYAYSAEQMRDYARAALSAQPSPGGQGDAFHCGRCKGRGYVDVDVDVDESGSSIGNIEACPHCTLAARQPVGQEPVPLGYTDPIPCAWSDDDASSLITLRDALTKVIAGTTTKDAAHFLKQPGQRRMTIKDAQEIAAAHLPYVESLMRRSQGFDVQRSHSLEREPVGFVLYEQQDKLVLFKGSWETDERWFWPEREQAQTAADRLHETHGFPNSYWLVTPVSAAPAAKPVALDTLQRFAPHPENRSFGWMQGMREESSGDWLHIDDVRALIDSQAVGNG
ncbi:TPA: hypothetical protein UOA81_001903 [Stenotrophomonas maltophilia]|nr:hypothetical protein [Stenotrophomonas maltophilia]